MPPLMHDQAAERAAAGAAAHGLNRILDRLVGRNPPFVFRMRAARIGQLVNAVKFLRLQRFRGRLDDEQPIAVPLQEPAAGLEIHLLLDHDRRSHKRIPVGQRLLIARQEQITVAGVERLGGLFAQQPRRAADAVERLIRREPAEHLGRGTLAHAVDQNIRLRIEQDRPPDLILPVVVVRDAAEARLKAAELNPDSGKRLPDQLRIDDQRMRRPPAGFAVLAEAVVLAEAAADGIDVDHRIHIAGGHADADARAAHDLQRFGVPPVGLGQHGHPIALGLQHPADDRNAERRVIDITVPRDQENIELLVTRLLHLGTGRGQELRLNGHLRAAFMLPLFGIERGGVKLRFFRFVNGTGWSARSFGGNWA